MLELSELETLETLLRIFQREFDQDGIEYSDIAAVIDIVAIALEEGG